MALPVDSKVPIYILVLWQPLQLVLLKTENDMCLTTVTTNYNKLLVKCLVPMTKGLHIVFRHIVKLSNQPNANTVKEKYFLKNNNLNSIANPVLLCCN